MPNLLAVTTIIVTSKLIFFFFFYCCSHHRDLHSFPTRRSSDLHSLRFRDSARSWARSPRRNDTDSGDKDLADFTQDRKSTRLNSSHVAISYAVFCLKKKKRINRKTHCITSNWPTHLCIVPMICQ